MNRLILLGFIAQTACVSGEIAYYPDTTVTDYGLTVIDDPGYVDIDSVFLDTMAHHGIKHPLPSVLIQFMHEFEDPTTEIDGEDWLIAGLYNRELKIAMVLKSSRNGINLTRCDVVRTVSHEIQHYYVDVYRNGKGHGYPFDYDLEAKVNYSCKHGGSYLKDGCDNNKLDGNGESIVENKDCDDA